MLYYVYVSDAGVPRTGLTLQWRSLYSARSGTDKTGSAPAINEIGDGWYGFDIIFGKAPWDLTDEDLVGVIDVGTELIGLDRYRPVAITLRGLGLARIAHKGSQNKINGQIDIYATDGITKELTLEMNDQSDSIIRNPRPAEA